MLSFLVIFNLQVNNLDREKSRISLLFVESPDFFFVGLQIFHHQELAALKTTTFGGSGRHGGLTVSALDSGSNGPGSSPGRLALHCVLGQDT